MTISIDVEEEEEDIVVVLVTVRSFIENINQFTVAKVLYSALTVSNCAAVLHWHSSRLI